MDKEVWIEREKVGMCSYYKNTIQVLGKFAILWNMFENEFFDKNCNKREIKNRKYSSKIKITPELLKLANKLRFELKCYLSTDNLKDKNKVVKLFYDKDDLNEIQENVYEYLNELEQNDDDLLQGCLFVCLRLRNNLFHGIKEKYSLDDQVDIFIALNELLEYIINENKKPSII